MCLFDEDVMEPMPATNAMAAMDAINSAESFVKAFKRVHASMERLNEQLEEVAREDLPSTETSFKRARLEYERHTKHGIPGPREQFVKKCVRWLDAFRMGTIDGDTLFCEMSVEANRLRSWPNGEAIWAQSTIPTSDDPAHRSPDCRKLA